VDDDRRPDPIGRILGDFVRHVSDQVVVPPFTAGRRRTSFLHLPARGERHLVAAAVVVVAVAVAVVLAVLYGPRSTVTGHGNGVAGHPAGTTWRVAATGQWSRVFAAPNISNYGAQDTITCLPGSISTCDVTANSISLRGFTSTSAAYRTTDSGSTWQRLILPARTWLSSKFSCSGPRTCAVGADIGFAATQTPDFSGRAAILTTDDGGRRWTVRDLPSAYGLVTDLSCPTPAHCVAFAWLRGGDPLPNPEAGFDRYYPTTVLTTNNGGRTWSRASLPPAAPPTVRYALASNVGGSLSCPTTTICDATGEEAEIVTTGGAYVQQDDRSVALVSTDGGRSWTITHRTAIVGPGSLSISCVDGSRCRMLANPGPGLTSPYGVFASDDGGRRWSPVADTGLPLPEAAELGSITCPSVDHCLVPANGTGSVSPTILATADGGRHWQAEALPPPPTGVTGRSVAGLSCGGSGSCLALVDESLRSPSLGVVADEVLTNVPRSGG